jgi:uncharacterized protein YcbK (DUF882 family)
MPSRRQVLTTFAAGALTLVTHPVRASLATGPRELHLNHLHTGETLAVEYFQAGHYQPDALAAVNHLLRDFRTGETHPIDPTLLDVLFEVRHRVDTRRAFEVVSGYRSPHTNAALRRNSEGVAAHSLHMSGRAVDIRVGDVPLARLRRSALALHAGGVGYYPASNFVHLDTGRVRTW